jgi:hypothetical protein
MAIPRIKKKMTAFVGCGIGERRLGILKSLYDKDTEMKKLVELGYLSAETEGKRVWLALTSKGKQHVIPREKYWSAW